MKVILLEDVRNLGKKDSLVEVSDGYGRNFLIGKNLAVEATAQAQKELKDKQAVAKRKDERLKAEALEIRSKIVSKVVRMSVSAGDGGKLFGSVTTAQVSEAIKKQYGVDVDRKNIKIEGAVKAIGSYALHLKLYGGIEAPMTLIIEGV